MFLTGFNKTAATLVTLSPEEYYDVVRAKDPYVGAVVGGALGGAIGAAKGKSYRSALIGAAVGAGAGGAGAFAGSKALSRYQAGRVRRMASDLNLKSTPNHSATANRS